MAQKVNISKWGEDFGFRIPDEVAEELGLKEGTPIELTLDGDVLRIRKSRRTLEEMIAKIDPDNLPENIESDGPRGNEYW